MTPIERLAIPLLRASLRGALHDKVDGRLVDPSRPELGRLGSDDVRRIEARLWEHVDALLPRAGLERYPLIGNRLNALLGVVTVAAYRAHREAGLSHERAVRLFGDAGWIIYRRMLVVPRLVANVLERDPQRRMNRILRMWLRFPFGQPSDPEAPGYHATLSEEPDRFLTHWSACPPLETVRRLGGEEELDAFRQTWCQYDYAAAREMVPGGRFERPHALSAGDPVCDMSWVAGGRLVQLDPQRGRSSDGHARRGPPSTGRRLG